jgi:uncharacterized repeat protein (TIGR02543 family)
MIYKFMIVFVALAMVAVFPMRAFADTNEPITIVTQPEDYTGPEGDVATFSVAAQGQSLSYQWQVFKAGVWKNTSLAGNKTSSISVEVIQSRDNMQFRCVVTDAENNKAESKAATLHVGLGPEQLSILTQPEDFSGAIGDIATLSVVAQGEGLSYQWQVYKSGVWKNTSLAGNKTSTMSVELLESRDGMQFRCVVTDADNESVASDPATISIAQPVSLSIVTQPENYFGQIGDVCNLTVIAEGEGLTYQWQVYKSGVWKNTSLAGNKSSTMSVELLESRDGMQFRCVITDKNNESVTTDSVSINIEQFDIISEPEDFYGDLGDVAIFAVEATGKGLSYQWQVYKNGTWKNTTIAGNKTSELSVDFTESRIGMQFRCVITDENNETLISKTVSLYPGQVYVTFDAGDGYFADIDNSSVFVASVNPGYHFLNDMACPEIEGNYAFRGWLDENNKPVNYVNITSDMTVHADWMKIYSVTYDANGGKFSDGQSKYVNDWATPGYYYIGRELVEEPVRDGYMFTGWLYNGQLLSRIPINSDITVKAQWVESVTVTFNANGGYWDFGDGKFTTVTDTYIKGTPYFVGWHEPMREGYRFVGWKVNNDWAGQMTLTENIEAVAVWSEHVEVKYDPMGGTFHMDYHDDESGNDVHIVTNDVQVDYADTSEHYWVSFWWPEKDGYEFIGWSTDPDATTASTDYEYNLTGATTFYAIYRQYSKFIYNANEGFFGPRPQEGEQNPSEQPYSQKVEFISAGEYYYIRNEEPWRDNYEFMGWADDEGNDISDKEYITEPGMVVTANAVWAKRIKVTYNANGGDFGDFDPNNGETSSRIHYRYVLEGEDFWLDDWTPHRDDYGFMGWSTNPTKLVDLPEKYTNDVTLYAIWYKPAVITYVTDRFGWNDNGNLITGFDRRVDYDGSTKIDGWWPDHEMPYQFVGYTTDPESTLVTDKNSAVIEYRPNDFIPFVAEDMTLFAVWYKNPTITFKTTIGQFGDGTTENIRWENEGFKFRVSFEEPRADGYVLVGWLDKDGNDLTDTWITAEAGVDYVFTAKMVLRGSNEYLVTYAPNGGTYGEPEGEDYRSWTVPSDRYYRVGCEWPQREGYDFIGWSTDPNATTAETEFDYTLTEDTTFYAIWERRVKVTYNAGEGVLYAAFDHYDSEGNFTYTSLDPVHSKVDYMKTGETLTGYGMPYAEKEGYMFDGWAINGERVNLYVLGTEDVVLEPIWIKTYEVILDANGGEIYNGATAVTVDTLYCDEGEYLPVFWWREVAARDGFICAGWTLDGELINGLVVTDNVTLKAVWVPDSEYEV